MILPALATLRRLVGSAESDAVQLQAARDILDRVGMGKTADKIQAETAIEIRVSYADLGPATPPGRVRERSNGHALGDGQQSF